MSSLSLSPRLPAASFAGEAGCADGDIASKGEDAGVAAVGTASLASLGDGAAGGRAMSPLSPVKICGAVNSSDASLVEGALIGTAPSRALLAGSVTEAAAVAVDTAARVSSVESAASAVEAAPESTIMGVTASLPTVLGAEGTPAAVASIAAAGRDSAVIIASPPDAPLPPLLLLLPLLSSAAVAAGASGRSDASFARIASDSAAISSDSMAGMGRRPM